MNQQVRTVSQHTFQGLQGNLDGRTAVIVGGTSGIGLSAAIQAKAAGAQVIVVGVDRNRAAAAAQEHGFAGWRAVDVTDAQCRRTK